MENFPDPISVAGGLSLTEIRDSDRPSYVEHLKAREIYDNTLRIPYPYSERDAEQWTAFNADLRARGKIFSWAIRDPDERLIGGIGLNDAFEIGATHKSEIGYWLARPHWNQGILSRVLPAFCEFAFRHFKLVRLTATVFVGNRASERVLEKSGFTYEGYLTKYYLKDSKFIDGKLFARTL